MNSNIFSIQLTKMFWKQNSLNCLGHIGTRPSYNTSTCSPQQNMFYQVETRPWHDLYNFTWRFSVSSQKNCFIYTFKRYFSGKKIISEKIANFSKSRRWRNHYAEFSYMRLGVLTLIVFIQNQGGVVEDTYVSGWFALRITLQLFNNLLLYRNFASI